MTERSERPANDGADVCAGCGRRTSPPNIACSNCGCIRADRSGAFYVAPRLRRLAAYIVDVVALGIVGVVATSLLGDWVDHEDGRPTLETSDLDGLLSALIVLIVGVAVWTLTMRKGQSPGMKLANIQVRRIGGAVPAPARFLLRDLWPFAVSTMVALIGLAASESAEATLVWLGYTIGALQLLSGAWVLWDRDRRALHDLVFDTVVVEQRPPPLSRRLGGSEFERRE